MIAKRHTLAVFMLLSVIGAVSGQETESRSRQITTTSSVTVHAKPDAARLSFFVAVEVPKDAREENDKQVAKMKEKLAALSLTNVEIQTVPFPLRTITLAEKAAKGFNPGGGAVPAVKGTKLQHAQTEFVLLIHEKDADKLCALVTKFADLAVENGASSTGTIEDPFAKSTLLSTLRSNSTTLKIEWLRKNTADARRQAIKQAVEEARSNAEAVLPGAKLTLENVQVSRERSTSSLTRGEAVGIDVPITVEVTAVYSFE